MHKLEQIDYIVPNVIMTSMSFMLLFHFGKLKIILRNSGWSAKIKFQLVFDRFQLFFTEDKIFPEKQPGVKIFVAAKTPKFISEIFPQLCASAPTKDMIICFPWTGLFFLFGVEKNSTSNWKKYSISLSANEVVECNRLKNTTNIFKHYCEKIKMSSNKVLEEELVIK